MNTRPPAFTAGVVLTAMLLASPLAMAVMPSGGFGPPSGPEIIGVDKDGRPIRRSEQGATERQADGRCISRLARDFGAVVECPAPKTEARPAAS
jgi:hypothetical protein